MKLRFHIIGIVVVTILAAISFYFPEPFNTVYGILFIGSFVSCSVVGYSAIFRNRGSRLLTLNPVEQAKVSASIYLNRAEKIILIYALFIFLGCIGTLLVSPAIEILKIQKL